MKKLLEANTAHGGRRISQVFRDFCELTALRFRSSVDHGAGFADRQARFAALAGEYSSDELTRFEQVLEGVVSTFEAGLGDVLGELYMSLDLGNERMGQFFTPFAVGVVSAKITIGDLLPQFAEKEFITVHEPACGSGGMIVALAEALREADVNYQRQIHVTAVDLDPVAVWMSYIQLTLLHIPALIVHGNTLTLEQFDVWPTPAHVLGGWGQKLANGQTSIGSRLPLVRS